MMKNLIRLELKNKLKTLSKNEIKKSNKIINFKLLSLLDSLIEREKHKPVINIGIYIKQREEVALAFETLKILKSKNYNMLFPTWDIKNKNKGMKFLKISNFEIIKNIFKEEESFCETKSINIIDFLNSKNCEEREVETIPNIIILPMLAFNLSNFRLGSGFGYYDKYLEKNKDITTIGLAYDVQKLECNFQENLDKKLNFIITERNIYTI